MDKNSFCSLPKYVYQLYKSKRLHLQLQDSHNVYIFRTRSCACKIATAVEICNFLLYCLGISASSRDKLNEICRKAFSKSINSWSISTFNMQCLMRSFPNFLLLYRHQITFHHNISYLIPYHKSETNGL